MPIVSHTEITENQMESMLVQDYMTYQLAIPNKASPNYKGKMTDWTQTLDLNKNVFHHFHTSAPGVTALADLG